ncbi:Plasmodium exported protein (Pm-fam-a like), unknown function [Plasmodium malariae]|uniref:Uncharacterized protein n=1 Tax=Plasmodium malariae TaxID=5858 RepID=A0A1A8X168_PLAMA|nr:Plasmodium exported protein (Pm-fam-a like), unknown function [Plasmodium malariae]
MLFRTSSLNKNFDEKCNLRRKLNTINYRLLVIYKKDRDSFTTNFKKEIPNDEVKERNYICNCKKGTYGKHKPLCRSSLYIEVFGKNTKKNKSCIPKTKKYPNFEKNIFRELDYNDYLKNIKEIEDKEYKKVARKKRVIRVVLLLLFILVLTVPILDLLLEKCVTGGLLGTLGLLSLTKIDSVYSLEGLLSTVFDIEGWKKELIRSNMCYSVKTNLTYSSIFSDILINYKNKYLYFINTPNCIDAFMDNIKNLCTSSVNFNI